MDLCLRDYLIRVTDTPQITIWEQLTNKLTQPNNQKSLQSLKEFMVVLVSYLQTSHIPDIRIGKIFKLFISSATNLES